MISIQSTYGGAGVSNAESYTASSYSSTSFLTTAASAGTTISYREDVATTTYTSANDKEESEDFNKNRRTFTYTATNTQFASASNSGTYPNIPQLPFTMSYSGTTANSMFSSEISEHEEKTEIRFSTFRYITFDRYSRTQSWGATVHFENSLTEQVGSSFVSQISTGGTTYASISTYSEVAWTSIENFTTTTGYSQFANGVLIASESGIESESDTRAPRSLNSYNYSTTTTTETNIGETTGTSLVDGQPVTSAWGDTTVITYTRITYLSTSSQTLASFVTLIDIEIVDTKSEIAYNITKSSRTTGFADSLGSTYSQSTHTVSFGSLTQTWSLNSGSTSSFSTTTTAYSTGTGSETSKPHTVTTTSTASFTHTALVADISFPWSSYTYSSRGVTTTTSEIYLTTTITTSLSSNVPYSWVTLTEELVSFSTFGLTYASSPTGTATVEFAVSWSYLSAVEYLEGVYLEPNPNLVQGLSRTRATATLLATSNFAGEQSMSVLHPGEGLRHPNSIGSAGPMFGNLSLVPSIPWPWHGHQSPNSLLHVPLYFPGTTSYASGGTGFTYSRSGFGVNVTTRAGTSTGTFNASFAAPSPRTQYLFSEFTYFPIAASRFGGVAEQALFKSTFSRGPGYYDFTIVSSNGSTSRVTTTLSSASMATDSQNAYALQTQKPAPMTITVATTEEIIHNRRPEFPRQTFSKFPDQS